MDISTGQTLGKDDFLTLFITQLRYQDPLDPLDSTEFTSQLAQFSSLEQLTNINEQMDNLMLFQNSLQNTLTTSLIGRKVKFDGEEIYLKDNAEINYTLSEDASEVKISISDSSGNIVREVNLGTQTAGNKNYVWDGKDSNGATLPEGKYTIKVEAYDADGNPVEATTSIWGTVTGVTFEDNITYLIIDGMTKIQLSDIKEIS
ncbi:MAG: FlgD immunoglobulin-like domain containing protein [Nitrospirota bacterium]